MEPLKGGRFVMACAIQHPEPNCGSIGFAGRQLQRLPQIPLQNKADYPSLFNICIAHYCISVSKRNMVPQARAPSPPPPPARALTRNTFPHRAHEVQVRSAEQRVDKKIINFP